MRTTIRTIAAVLALALPIQRAQAQLLTSDFGGTQATAFHCEDNFTSFCYTRGPLEVGTNGYSVTVTSGLKTTNSAGSVIGTGQYGLATNGNWWGDAGTYAGTDGTGVMEFGLRFTFDRPVYSVGAWMNYSTIADAPAYLRALGIDGSLIAQYDLRHLAPISTPNRINGQEFRGIQSSNGIYTFELAGSYLITRDLFVSEDAPPAEQLFGRGSVGDQGDGPGEPFIVEQSPTVVTPEPGTYVLVAAGLAGLGFLKRRRRA